MTGEGRRFSQNSAKTAKLLLLVEEIEELLGTLEPSVAKDSLEAAWEQMLISIMDGMAKAKEILANQESTEESAESILPMWDDLIDRLINIADTLRAETLTAVGRIYN